MNTDGEMQANALAIANLFNVPQTFAEEIDQLLCQISKGSINAALERQKGLRMTIQSPDNEILLEASMIFVSY